MNQISNDISKNWQLILAILGWLFSILSFFLGKSFEKKVRSNLTRKEFIEFIENWCGKIYKLNTMTIDEMNSFRLGTSEPINYTFEERREIANSLSAMDNKLQGIIKSDVLRNKKNKKQIDELIAEISEIDSLVKKDLMALQEQFYVSFNNGNSSQGVIFELLRISSIIKQKQEKIHSILSILKIEFS